MEFSICKCCGMYDTYICNGDNNMCTECCTIDPGFEFQEEEDE